MLITPAKHGCDNGCGQETTDPATWHHVSLELTLPRPPIKPGERPIPPPTPLPRKSLVCSEKCLRERVDKIITDQIAALKKAMDAATARAAAMAEATKGAKK